MRAGISLPISFSATVRFKAEPSNLRFKGIRDDLTSLDHGGRFLGHIGTNRRNRAHRKLAQMAEIFPFQIANFAWMEPGSTGSCRAAIFINGIDLATQQWTCNALDAPCYGSVGSGLGISFESTGSTGALKLPCSVEQPITCCALVP
jgi:hypothetical protein